MTIAVVGAGLGRTGTHSLKIALEQLLGGPCHHMVEMFPDPVQQANWTAAIDGGGVADWPAMLANYRSIVDWPGASFWPELSAAFPEALVLLSTRDPESWYRSASDTIFLTLDGGPPGTEDWMTAVGRLLDARFCTDFGNPTAMMDAFDRHNEAVRAGVPADRLLEWTAADGWEPICERLGLPVPAEPFPLTNTTTEFREMIGIEPMEA